MNDRQLKISAAGNRWSKNWPTLQITWRGFLDKIKTPQRTSESYAEYMKLSKPQQDDLKDVGGFVGGELKDGRRKAVNVLSRDLITLDLDSIPAGEAQTVDRKVQTMFGCAYAIYSTRKHSTYKPRLRVIIPTDRTIAPDEYEPIARKVAELIGMGYADPTTFQAERLMYWPSASADGEFTFTSRDGGFLRADAILDMYQNWRDVTQWPVVPGQSALDHARTAQKQGDPLTKPGVIGAFCRTYTIQEAMDKFIPESYEPTDEPDRFTYKGGSTSGGAIVYDDKFLFSYHATDPTSGKLVNAFDLVRLHLYGDQDDDAKDGTPITRMPSYMAMTAQAMADETVKILLATDRMGQAREEFNLPAEADTDWLTKLELSPTTTKPLPTIKNMLLILANDPELKDKIALDEFANRGVAKGPLPWNQHLGTRNWTDIDEAGIRYHLEALYGITGKEKIYDAVALEAYKNRYDDVRDFLKTLTWDGKERLDRLFIDFLGCEDTPYTRAVTRKSFTAAAARALRPGTKYDFMPILTGPQGLGKSTLLRLMGKNWYSDSLTTFEGKEASEMLQGVWINEIGELNGLNRGETNAVKQFLSKVEDLFRVPYGRRTEVFKRRCVFFGTSNDDEFLKDRTGNRRFWPIVCAVTQPSRSIWDELGSEVNQLWAEAMARLEEGEPLYLTGEIEEYAKKVQEAHMETSSKQGLIMEFLEKEIPLHWDDLDIATRRSWFAAGHLGDPALTQKRERVTAIEIWCEAFGNPEGTLRRQDTMELNGIMRGLPGWKPLKVSRFGPYGLQRGFEKTKK